MNEIALTLTVLILFNSLISPPDHLLGDEESLLHLAWIPGHASFKLQFKGLEPRTPDEGPLGLLDLFLDELWNAGHGVFDKAAFASISLSHHRDFPSSNSTDPVLSSLHIL